MCIYIHIYDKHGSCVKEVVHDDSTSTILPQPLFASLDPQGFLRSKPSAFTPDSDHKNSLHKNFPGSGSPQHPHCDRQRPFKTQGLGPKQTK